MSEDKTLDLSKTVYELGTAHPDLLPIMARMGFPEIVTPGLLNTAGRFMTIPKGAKMKGVDLEELKQAFREGGFIIKEDNHE